MLRASERKIALCVSSWSADSTLYAWTFAKNFFLRVRVPPLQHTYTYGCNSLSGICDC